MDRRMWFGTRGYMKFVKAPAIDMDNSKHGYTSSAKYLNGGARVRSSTGAHKEYVLSWNLVSRDEARKITDYDDGLYDTQRGTNLIYFLDPMVLDKNVLPQLWASPFQSAVDGLTLFPGQTPSVAATPPNSLGYPARSAVYVANTPSRSLWIPVPPGYVAWVGVHGSATGTAGMTVATTYGQTASTPQRLDLLPVTTTQRFNHSVAASASVDGIMLGMVNNGPDSTDTFTWAGTMVQILKAGVTPAAGDFISGQGHSGCQFDGKPTTTAYSAVLGAERDGLVGVSAKLVETGAWL